MATKPKTDPVELSFASEEPYERWWGIEILECTREAVDLSRMNDGAALLVGHHDMIHVGTVERGTAVVRGDRKLACSVRFATDEESQRYRQRVDDGVLTKVSVGYLIQELVEENVNETGARTSRTVSDERALAVMHLALKEERGDREAFYRDLDEIAGPVERAASVSTFRVTRWQPFEVSLVSIPADPTVGVGRNADLPRATRVFSTHAGQAGRQPQEKQMDEVKERPAAPAPVDVRVIENQARDAERQRAADIRALGKELDAADLAERAVTEGHSVDQFRAALIDKLKAGGNSRFRPAESSELGMTERDLRRFSLCRLLLAVMDPLDTEAQKRAGFELELSRAAREKAGKRSTYKAEERANGMMVPVDVLRAPAAAFGEEFAAAYARALPQAIARRDLNVGTATAGGNLVSTDLLSGSFIDLLRARSRVMQLGATVLDGLEGNVAIPRQTGGASTFWVTEGGDVSESQMAVDQVTLSPKTIGMFTDYTRRMLLQSSIAIEALVRADQALGIGTGMDVAAINGSGSSGQPTGILNASGTGSVAGGTNGAAPTWAHMVDLEGAVANANADFGRLAYLTNSRVRTRLRKTEKFTGTNGDEVWEDGRESGMGMVAGYDAWVSNNVPNTLTKGTSVGNCSAIIFANWVELLIGMWGGLDYILDPSALALSGGRRLVALQDCDIQLRRPQSFACMKDALTA